MTLEARRDFKLKHEAHEARERALRREHEAKVEEQRQQAAQKKASMTRVQARWRTGVVRVWVDGVRRSAWARSALRGLRWREWRRVTSGFCRCG